MRKVQVFCGVSTGVIIGLLPCANASAQTAASGSGASAVEEVVVTGSLIARRDFSSPSPIVTVGAQRLQESGQITLEAALNQLPQLQTGTSSTTIQNRTGRASLNLRGLGEQRSLILLDGRRIQPAVPSGVVDVNILPSIVISNVETITGGASAAYGSDAMAGVINFKLRQSFTGLQMDAQASGYQHGGASAAELSVLAGTKFNEDRGNAFLAVSYADRDHVQRKDRDFTQVSTLIGRIGNAVVDLSSSTPSQSTIDTVFGRYGVAAGTVNRSTTLGINGNGTLFTPVPGTGRPIVNYQGPLNDVYLITNNSIQQNSGYYYDLVNPLSRISTLGRVNYDFGHEVKGFVEVLYTGYKTSDRTSPGQIGLTGSAATMPVTNPFIPADLRTVLASRAAPGAAFSVTQTFEQLGLLTSQVQWNVGQIIAGLSGHAPIRDWTWDVYATGGRTHQDETFQNTYSLSAVQTLLNAPDGGASLCAGGFNVFSPQAISTACVNYIRHNANSSLTIDQAVAQASLQGSLVTLPAGPVRFAAGVDARTESYDDKEDAHVGVNDIPGVVAGPSSSGSRNVTEAFGELLVPLIADVPLIKALEADIGYRYSDYSTGSGVQSYTANLDWTIVPQLKLRGGYSRAIRAPSLQDLYAPAVQAQLRLGSPSATSTGGDPCDVRSGYRQGASAAQVRALCLGLGVPAAAIDSYSFNASTIFGASSGNPDLRNEYADTYSAGIVFSSPFNHPLLASLRGSVDVFDIKIHDAIGQLPLSSALARCFNTGGVGNPTYSAANLNCSFFPRNPATGQVNAATVPLLNLAQYETSGVDVQLEWQTRFEDVGLGLPGSLKANLVGTYLDQFKIQTLPDTPVLDYVGTSQSPIDPNGRASVLPRWKSVTTFTYAVGPLEASLRWRYVSSVKDVSLVTNPASTTAGAPAYNYFDAFARIEVNDKTEVRFGVNNVADKEPPVLSATLGNTDTQTYDVLGRSFYVAVRRTF